MAKRRPAPPTDLIREGRPAPSYTDVQDWVGLADITPQAHSLYVKLRMHVNTQRGDERAWPGKERLAMMMRVGRGDYIDGWLAELVAIGAVEIRPEGMPRRNVYIVYALPPPGYDGPLTLTEWKDTFDGAAELRRQAARERAQRHRDKVRAMKGQVKPVTGSDRSQQARPLVTDDSRSHVTGQEREHVTGQGRSELTEVELTEVEPTPPRPRREQPTSLRASKGGGIDHKDSENNPLEALVNDLCAARPRWGRAAVRRLIDEETAAGVSLPLLAEAARRCAADPVTRAPGRIREAGPWWDIAAQVTGHRQTTWPTWCGRCNEQTRLTDDDRPRRCPDCHPSSPRTVGTPA